MSDHGTPPKSRSPDHLCASRLGVTADCFDPGVELQVPLLLWRITVPTETPQHATYFWGCSVFCGLIFNGVMSMLGLYGHC